MTVFEWLVSAGRRAWPRYKTEPVALTAPLFLAGVVTRAVAFGFKHTFSGKHVLLDLVVLLFVTFPLDLLAGIVTARLYVRRREGLEWSAQDLRKAVRSREALFLVGRLEAVTVLWMFVGAILAFLIALLPRLWKAFLFGIRHPGLKLPPPAHHSNLVFMILWLLISCSLLSRYTLVVPLFVTGRFSAKQAMQSGVKLARGTLVALSVLAVVGVALSYGFGRPMRRLENGAWVKRIAVGLAVLLESSVVYSVSATVGAELAYSKWDDRELGEV